MSGNAILKYRGHAKVTEWTDPQKLDQKSNYWEVGFFMAKYSFEFKMEVVQAYLNAEGGYR